MTMSRRRRFLIYCISLQISERERPSAKKVLVVITDSKSTSPLDNLKAAGKLSKEDGIKVIVFGIGKNTDDKELMAITSKDNDIINANTTDKPADSNKVIMDKVFGKFGLLTP